MECWNNGTMEMMKSDRKIKAIIWDYDGTLVDTRLKNYNVTKRIIKDMTGINPEKLLALKSLDSYISANNRAANWRDLYKKEFSFTEEQIDYSGKLWTPYQLEDRTPVLFFDGIQDVIHSLKMFPQGIVSQNSKHGIVQQLEDNQLGEYFSCIIGYEEVPLDKQKPAPDGLLLCIENLTKTNSGLVIYIGDHETDMQCAHNANQQLINSASDVVIITIGALYGFNSKKINWNIQPNYEANKPGNILEIIQNL